MAKIGIGINLEFVRHADKSFEWGVAKAAELGYEYVEPLVHWGRELLSEAGYFHSVSMLDDPFRIRASGQGQAHPESVQVVGVTRVHAHSRQEPGAPGHQRGGPGPTR